MNNYELLCEFERRKKLNKELTIGQFAKEHKMNRNTMKSKLYRGMKASKAFTATNTNQPHILKEEMVIEEDKNTKTITYKAPLESARITTLKELLKYAEVDTDVWEVKDWSPNSWTVTAVINGQFKTATNFQVKARLIRKIPISISPVIQPVVIDIKPLELPRKHSKSALNVSVALFDLHIGFSFDKKGNLVPYQDRNAIANALAVCEHLDENFGIKEIILAGDALDLAEWSTKFVTRPEFYGTTQPALKEMAWLLSYMKRKFSRTKIIFMDGNHEKRVEDSIIEHLGWAYRLTPGDLEDTNTEVFTIQNLLGLDRMGIEYRGNYPNNDVWLNDYLKISHGSIARNASTATAKAVLGQDRVSVVYGHIHREEVATEIESRREERKVIRAVCPGCLCHVDGRIPPVGRQTRWTNGFAVLWYDDKSEFIDTVPIVDNQAVYHGKSFKADSYYKEMIKEISL